MKLRIVDVLARGRKLLEARGIEDAEIEAELLLRHALEPGMSRADLYRTMLDEIESDVIATYEGLVERRIVHEPSAYIIGRREFYGFDLLLTHNVLIPRPETEQLVELAINAARTVESPRVVDVGTGSGAIAIALAKTLPKAQIIATDASWEALSVARLNATTQAVDDRIEFQPGDLLESLNAPVDVIVANLPYIPTHDWERLAPEVRDHEPRSALDGGIDGLAVIHRLLGQAPMHLRPRGVVLLEFGYGQSAAIEALARAAFPDADIDVHDDFAGIPRVLVIET